MRSEIFAVINDVLLRYLMKNQHINDFSNDDDPYVASDPENMLKDNIDK